MGGNFLWRGSKFVWKVSSEILPLHPIKCLPPYAQNILPCQPLKNKYLPCDPKTILVIPSPKKFGAFQNVLLPKPKIFCHAPPPKCLFLATHPKFFCHPKKLCHSPPSIFCHPHSKFFGQSHPQTILIYHFPTTFLPPHSPQQICTTPAQKCFSNPHLFLYTLHNLILNPESMNLIELQKISLIFLKFKCSTRNMSAFTLIKLIFGGT